MKDSSLDPIVRCASAISKPCIDGRFVSDAEYGNNDSLIPCSDSDDLADDNSYFAEYASVIGKHAESLPSPKNTLQNETASIKLLPDINQQYLGDSLKVSLLTCASLLVESPQGTGKTSAVKALLRDEYKVLMMSPRDKLNQALSKELSGFSYYVDIKKAIQQKQNSDVIIPMIERMTCTPQSLPALAAYYEQHTGQKLSYNVLVLDEIEAIAEMLTSNVTRDKTGVLSAFKDVGKRSMVRVGLDAFPTEKSRYLMALLSPDGAYGMLKNTYKRWSNINATILEGGNYKKRANALQVLQRKAIIEGKRVAITSSSAGYCKLAYRNLKALHPELRMILVDRDGSPEATALMNDTSLIGHYDVIVYTPTINVGVSFDIQSHVNCIFAAFPNAERTGGTSDALQALARVRHPIDNQWFIALDSCKNLFNVGRSRILDDEVVSILTRRCVQEAWGAGVVDAPTCDELEVIKLFAINEGDRVQDKNNFNPVFESKLRGMGVVVDQLPISSIGSDAELGVVTEQVKLAMEVAEVQAKTKSARIDEREYNHIAMRLRHDKSSVTSAERDSVKRFKFESKFNINCDELSQSALDEFLELDDKGAIGQVINREIAEGATKEFNDRLMKARVVGLGDNGAFKVDAVDEKLGYRLKARLLAYATPYFDGEVYDHKSLKRSGLVQFVARNEKEILVSKAVSLPSGWRQKPALLMNHLIESCGFKVTMSRKDVNPSNGNKARKIQQWRGVSVKSIDSLIADRLARNENWIHKTTTLMDMYQDMGAYLKPEHIEALQMPTVDINFVHDQLKLLPSQIKDSVLTEYRTRYDMMNPDNDGIEAPQKANDWLLQEVKNNTMENTVLTA